MSRQYEMSAEETDAAIREGVPTSAIREQILERLAQRSIATAIFTASIGGDDRRAEGRVRNALVAEALFARIEPTHTLNGEARQFHGISLRDAARDCLERSGFDTRGMSDGALIERGMATTSDFPVIAGELSNRLLRKRYEMEQTPLKKLARKVTAADFRERSSVQLSEAKALQKVNEAGEFKSAFISESAERYRVETFGNIARLSRQMIVNDDLDAFARLPQILSTSAAATEANVLTELLVGTAGTGAKMADGKALFHVDHKNLATTGTTLSEASLSAARLAMRRQKGISGEIITVAPRYLVIPPELETVAEKVLASIAAVRTTDVNAFAGKLEILVEPRMTDPLRWLIAGHPDQIDTMEYAYLDGHEGIYTETRWGFETDHFEVKARLDFGAGLIDWRGFFGNPGAAPVEPEE